MKYKCGMYGGSFNPLHQGHVRCIINAANQCERLIIVISCGNKRNEVDVRVRYRWIFQLTKHLPDIGIFILNDDCKSKNDYDENQWLIDADKVKKFAGEPIDAVFCGSDYTEDSFWKRCYPKADLIILPRDGVSSTAIRNDIFGHWDWIPQVVRPYYVKKILIIGTESTGKSTLTQNLALHFNTNFIEEVGRDISERSGTDTLMLPQDFTDILLNHKIREIEALEHSNRVIFEDTDCLITRFFLDFMDGKEKEKNAVLADAISALNRYDLILFCEHDVKFVQDGDRSTVIANDREKYSNIIRDIYIRHGFSLVSIGGSYQQRYEKAVKLVEDLISANNLRRK